MPSSHAIKKTGSALSGLKLLPVLIPRFSTEKFLAQVLTDFGKQASDGNDLDASVRGVSGWRIIRKSSARAQKVAQSGAWKFDRSQARFGIH